MSIDSLELEIKERAGTEEEKWQARRILPVISHKHLVLVSLLLFNSAAAEVRIIYKYIYMCVYIYTYVCRYVAIRRI
jgi:metal transporter CNNM